MQDNAKTSAKTVKTVSVNAATSSAIPTASATVETPATVIAPVAGETTSPVNITFVLKGRRAIIELAQEEGDIKLYKVTSSFGEENLPPNVATKTGSPSDRIIVASGGKLYVSSKQTDGTYHATSVGISQTAKGIKNAVAAVRQPVDAELPQGFLSAGVREVDAGAKTRKGFLFISAQSEAGGR